MDSSADAGRPRVVVGVDGSPGSRLALTEALAEVGRRGARLDVVAAYALPYVWTRGAPVEVPDAAASAPTPSGARGT